MKWLDKILTVVALFLVILGISSIETTPIMIPLLMILGGGMWIVYVANVYKSDV